MAVINFTIPASLENRIKKHISQRGFPSKAEFFRFAAIYYMDIIELPDTSEQRRKEFLYNSLNRELLKNYLKGINSDY